MHSNVVVKNVSLPHFSWPTLYIACKFHVILFQYLQIQRLSVSLSLTTGFGSRL